jgi:hypothetical protein
MEPSAVNAANPHPPPVVAQPPHIAPQPQIPNEPRENPTHNYPLQPVEPFRRTRKGKARGKARRLQVDIRKSKVWDRLIDTTAGITLGEWLAISPEGQKDLIDGIRYLRENKRRQNRLARNNDSTPMNIDSNPNPVNAVEHYENENWSEAVEEGEESFSGSSEYLEDSESNLTYDSQATESNSEILEEESIYEYPYSLGSMKNSSPLRGMVSINGKPVEAVFDFGASVSVLGKGLADELGLVASNDELPLIGFDGDDKVVRSKIILSVPIMIGSRTLRPEHMALKNTGNDHLCLLGVPWMQNYGIQIDICNSRVIIPTSRGDVTLHCFTTHVSNPTSAR